MKKTHVILLLAVFTTGLLLSGCQQPASPDTNLQRTNGQIEIVESGRMDTVEGSIDIVEPIEIESNASLVIKEAEEGASSAATEALEEAKNAVQ